MGIADRGNALSQVIVSDENIAPIPRLFHGEDIPILSRGGPLIPRHQFISWNVHAGSLVTQRGSFDSVSTEFSEQQIRQDARACCNSQ